MPKTQMPNTLLVVSASIPPEMEIEARSPFKQTWHIQNTGSHSWEGGRIIHTKGPHFGGPTWYPLPPALPGQTIPVSLTLTAPAELGRHQTEWQPQTSAGEALSPPLPITIIAVPGGANNGRLLSYTTAAPDGSSTPAPGQSFTHTITLENTGGRRWRANYQLIYLGGDAAATQPALPLPATIPGEANSLTLSLTAPATPGLYISFWQMRDEAGAPFGGFVGPEVRVIGVAAATQPFQPEAWRRVVWDITSLFESGRVGGNPAAFQNSDAGIVSYGRHQATLASGNLGRVLARYFELSQSATSTALQQEFAPRVQAQDPTLRQDGRFKELLLAAAAEAEMGTAQDDVFATGFYTPAVAAAQRIGLRTPLGVACIYDMRIQHGGGGADFLVERTHTAVGGPIGQPGVDEANWLAKLLDEREALLIRLAEKSERQGDNASGQLLRNSTFRVRELRQLLQANNFSLSGTFTVRGQQIIGL